MLFPLSRLQSDCPFRDGDLELALQRGESAGCSPSCWRVSRPASGQGDRSAPDLQADDDSLAFSARQKPKQDYEALLQSLSLQIQERQQRLSEIKLRERRTTLAFTLYAIGLWLLYAALWWFDALAPLARLPALLGWTGGEDELLGEEEGENELVRLGVLVLLALPALVGPVGCVPACLMASVESRS